MTIANLSLIIWVVASIAALLWAVLTWEVDE